MNQKEYEKKVEWLNSLRKYSLKEKIENACNEGFFKPSLQIEWWDSEEIQLSDNVYCLRIFDDLKFVPEEIAYLEIPKKQIEGDIRFIISFLQHFGNVKVIQSLRQVLRKGYKIRPAKLNGKYVDGTVLKLKFRKMKYITLSYFANTAREYGTLTALYEDDMNHITAVRIKETENAKFVSEIIEKPKYCFHEIL